MSYRKKLQEAFIEVIEESFPEMPDEAVKVIAMKLVYRVVLLKSKQREEVAKSIPNIYRKMKEPEPIRVVRMKDIKWEPDQFEVGWEVIPHFEFMKDEPKPPPAQNVD